LGIFGREFLESAPGAKVNKSGSLGARSRTCTSRGRNRPKDDTGGTATSVKGCLLNLNRRKDCGIREEKALPGTESERPRNSKGAIRSRKDSRATKGPARGNSTYVRERNTKNKTEEKEKERQITWLRGVEGEHEGARYQNLQKKPRRRSTELLRRRPYHPPS